MHHLEHICKAWRWQVAAAVYVGHDPTADEEKAGIKEVEDFAAKTTKQGEATLSLIMLYIRVNISFNCIALQGGAAWILPCIRA